MQGCAQGLETIKVPPGFNTRRNSATVYSGWATTVEVLATGDHPRIDGLPLQGLSFEAKGGSQAGDILVEAGDKGTAYETHLIHRPKVVRAADTRPGEETDIEIESEEGYTTIVHIRRRPELPEPRPARNGRSGD